MLVQDDIDLFDLLIKAISSTLATSTINTMGIKICNMSSIGMVGKGSIAYLP